MRKLWAVLFILVHFLPLFSDSLYEEPQDVSTSEGLPSSLVERTVCTITGEYTYSVTDVVLPGPESLVINRLYSSSSPSKPWSFNHHETLNVHNAIYEGEKVHLTTLRQPSGAHLDYIFKKRGDYLELKDIPFALVTPNGLTNCASGMCGKTNIKNQTLHFFPEDKCIEVVSGAGNKRKFKKVHGRAGKEFGLCKQESETKVNGSRYKYEGSVTGILGVSEIVCENKKTEKCFSFVKAGTRENGTEKWIQTLLTNDQRNFEYHFKEHTYHDNHERVQSVYLTKMDHPYAPCEDYEYGKRADSKELLLICKSKANGKRFVNIDYYHKGRNHVDGQIGNVDIEKDDDFRLDRVKKLHAPVGADQTPITTHRFDYYCDIKKHKDTGRKKLSKGHTFVYDALDHQIKYTYDKHHRLTSIIRYKGEKSSEYVPYSQECFIWGEDGYNEGCLLAKIFKDGHNRVHHARYFTYDKAGNVLTSTLCGKLTGKEAPELICDKNGNLIDNGYERETKTYTYSDDGLNLLLSENNATGKTITYKYHSHTDRLIAKLIAYNDCIRIREFYFYDDNHALNKKVIDNGTAEIYSDRTGITERHYTEYKPRTEMPVGLPEKIDEKYYDFDARQKTQLKSTTCIYSPEGRLLEQQVSDANGELAYLLKWEYDNHGNTVNETDAMGVTITRKYDVATDNLISEKSTSSPVKIKRTYDFVDRLIEQKEKHTDQDFTTSHTYDHLGNRTSTTNSFGHITKHAFDEFSRMIKITHPAVLNEKGVLENPIILKAYDIAGNPICITDPNGSQTFFEYNIRGQPTKISYPDGTIEKMRYDLTGQLVEKIAKNGTRTQYAYDPQGRLLKEAVIAAGVSLKTTQHEYNAFHRVKTIDPAESTTSYTYDSAGRVKEIVKDRTQQEYLYDSLGRISEIREFYGDKPEEYRSTMKKYDLFDRLIEETICSSDRTILHSTIYAYDARGNQILKQTGDQKQETLYNDHNLPIKTTNGLGGETHISYNYAYKNGSKQNVLQTITTDPLGYQTIHTYDAANRLVETKRVNPLQVKVACQKITYDLRGNQKQIEDEVIEAGEVKRSIKTFFEYNQNNELITLTEAAFTPEQKVTRTHYNAYGEKDKTTKPDGTELYYTYDSIGRLKTLKASDRTLSYHYEYNKNDQVTAVTDLVSCQITQRSYEYGELKSETLGNSLSLSYSYDRAGRLLTTIFPDQTGSELVYDAVDLKAIHRVINNQTTYSHYNQSCTLSGQLRQATPPGKNGQVDYRYNGLGHCTSLTSSHFTQTVPKNGIDLAGRLLQLETNETLQTFSYDDNSQLSSECGLSSHTYTYDSVSNRTKKDQASFSHNSLNQLLSNTYDKNGNLTLQANTTYTYDALDRLIKLTKDGITTTYAYDPFNRRISRNHQGNEELFFYQGQEEIGSYKNGSIQELRLLGKEQANNTVAIELNGAPYVPTIDIFGNIISLSTLDGTLIERYRYTAFGETEILSPEGDKRTHSVIINPWQYAGKRLDPETGLYAFGLRYYDPSQGRWITPDPAGFIDGPNLYAYVHNNPCLSYDQYGLCTDLLYGIGGQHLEVLYKSTFSDFCTDLSSNFPSSRVTHVGMEEKMELEYYRNGGLPNSFEKAGIFYASDFINPKTSQPYQFAELPPDKLIGYSNGMRNTFDDFRDNLIHLAKNSGGYNVVGVFTPTRGLFYDGLCAFHTQHNHVAYEGVRLTHMVFDNFFATASPAATLLWYPHSRGTIDMKVSLTDYPVERAKRVECIAIAPGGYIPNSLCHSVTHYISKTDPIPKIPFTGRSNTWNTVVALDPGKFAIGTHHSFQDDLYKKDIRLTSRDYLAR